jgi:predicted deacetylase
MNWELFMLFVAKIRQYQLKPILAVIPDNQSEEFRNYPHRSDFWEIIRTLYHEGWEIAIHGYNHVYTTRASGLLGINKRSEFAGLPYDTQQNKIRNAIRVFKKNGIHPRTFIAPSHSFDHTTLRILKEENIAVVSDGYFLYPYSKDGIRYVPQLSANCREMPFGVYTFCYHLNTVNRANFDRLIYFIDQHHQDIIGIEESLEYKKNGWIYQFVFPFLFRSVLKIKRVLTGNHSN